MSEIDAIVRRIRKGQMMRERAILALCNILSLRELDTDRDGFYRKAVSIVDGRTVRYVRFVGNRPVEVHINHG